jgi:hypothetical protein
MNGYWPKMTVIVNSIIFKGRSSLGEDNRQKMKKIRIVEETIWLTFFPLTQPQKVICFDQQ